MTNQVANLAEIRRREELERYVKLLLNSNANVRTNSFACRKLSQIANDLEDLKNGNQVLKYVMANNESGVISRIVEDVNTVIIDYQFTLQEETYGQVLKLIVSPNFFEYIPGSNILRFTAIRSFTSNYSIHIN